jgi:hypothetical protein
MTMNQRVQVSDDFNKPQLQTKASPIAVAQQAVGDPFAGSEWMGLANAFAKGEVLAGQVKQRQDEEDKLSAQRYANSMTVGELGKAIKSGQMMPSQSPVFAATVQHIWGDNARAAEERDLLGRVQTGELKFNAPEEIDQYLTESRNTALAGQSDYAAAGYDKAHPALRSKLMDAVAKQANGEQVEHAAGQAVESLMNGYANVTGPDFKGTPEEAASQLFQRYELMKRSAVLPEEASRGALTELAQRISGDGNGKLLESFLDQEMEGIGKVRTFLGEAKSKTLIAQSANIFDQTQRQRMDDEMLPHYQAADRGALDVESFLAWGTSEDNKKYISSATLHSIIRQNSAAIAAGERERQKAVIQGHSQASIAEAQKVTEAALSAGEFWKVNGQNKPQYINENGDVKDFDVKKYAEQALEKATRGLPIDQQVSSWALNGITNPDWQNRIRAGFFNLSTIGVDAKGKPIGELNAEGQASIDLFRQINQVNPEYAKQVAGESEYKRFGDIDFLQYMGKDVNTAAAIASAASSGAITNADIGNMTKKVRAKASELLDSPWSDFWGGMFGENTTHNTLQVSGLLRRYSELLALSGQYGDAETAVNKAAEYLANPKVTTKVNGTLYMRSELPQAPGAQEDQAEWFERFIDRGPKKVAQDIGFSPDMVRLEFDTSIRGYRAMAGGMPLGGPNGGMLVYSKRDIQEWYAIERQKDMNAELAKAQDGQTTKRHGAYKERLNTELRALQSQDSYVLEKYDASANHAFFNNRIFGEAAFRRIEQDGNADKPLRELMRLYPSKRKQ